MAQKSLEAANLGTESICAFGEYSRKRAVFRLQNQSLPGEKRQHSSCGRRRLARAFIYQAEEKSGLVADRETTKRAFGTDGEIADHPVRNTEHVAKVSMLTGLLEAAVIGTTLEGHEHAFYVAAAEDVVALLTTNRIITAADRAGALADISGPSALPSNP